MNASLLFRLSFALTFAVITTLQVDIVCAQQGARVWTDSTGRFKITATLVESLDGTVQLLTADGKTVKIPISRLSKADQEFLSGSANPFAAGDASAAPMSDTTTVPHAAGIESWETPALIDWSKIRQIDPSGVAGWDVPVANNQLGFEVTKGQLKKGVIPKENQHSFVAINPRCKRAVVGFSGTANGKVMSRVAMIDLVSGKSVYSQPLEGYFRPSCLLDDGSTVVMVGAAKWPKKENLRDEMQLWKFQGSNVQQSATWIPFKDDNKSFGKTSNSGIYESIPVVGNRVITHSSNGRVVLWNIENREPIWSAKGSSEKTAVTVTADGKQMAMFDGTSVSVIDLTTAKPLGSISLKGNNVSGWNRLMWSPSGEHLLFIAVGSVQVLDVKSGEWLHQYQLSESPIAMNTWDYPHQDFALIDGGVLLHLPSRIKVCTYGNASSMQTVGNVTFVTAWNDSVGVLMPIELPHTAATSILAKAQDDPTLFLLHPGVGVATDVSKVPAQYQAEAERLLRKSIEDSGYKVDASSGIRAVAAVSEPKQEAVSYIARGSYVVTQYTSSLALRWNNTSVFNRSTTNIPMMLQTKRDQTIQQALDEHSKAPSISFFGTIRFPKFMQKPSDGKSGGGALMKASITPRGVES